MPKVHVRLTNPLSIFMDKGQVAENQVLTGESVKELVRTERLEESLHTGQIEEVTAEGEATPKKKGK